MTAHTSTAFAALLFRVVLGFALWMMAERAPAGQTSDPLPEGTIARLGSTRFRHSGSVCCLAFSPDGKTLASGGLDGVVRFWDVKTGRQLHVSSRYWGVFALAFSPDGAFVAMRDWNTDKDGIFLLDAATAKEQRSVKFPHYDGCIPPIGNAVAFAPDGKILAASNAGGEICLFDPANGKELAVLGKHNHHNVPDLAFSPDGRMLASSGQDVTIRLWDVARRRALHVLHSESTYAVPIVFSRDGKWLISGGGRPKKSQQSASPQEHPAIRIWDTATGKQLRVFRDTEVQGLVRELALAPDGRTLAVSCEDRLRLWDMNTGKVLRTLPGACSSDSSIRKLCFSPDGKLLAGGLDHTVGLWDVASGRLLSVDANESTDAINCVAITSDGRLLAAGDGDGYLAFWDFRNRQLIRRFRGHDSSVSEIAISPDDKTLVSVAANGSLCAWDLANGRHRYRIPAGSPKAHRNTKLTFAPDRKMLAYTYASDKQEGNPLCIGLLDAATGAVRQNLSILPVDSLDCLVGIGFSADARHLIGATVDGKFYGWRRDGDCFVAKGLLAEEPWHNSVAFSVEGFLSVGTLSACSGRPPSFRDYPTCQPKHYLSGLPRLGDILALSRDGRYLAAIPYSHLGFDSKELTLRVCEMTTGQEVLCWRLSPDTGCHELAFAPDGRTLVAAMRDTTILLWDLFPAGKEAAKDMQTLWTVLADNDAARAYRAMCRLISTPADSVALLRLHLKPVEHMDEKRLARWTAELDADEFGMREKATAELQKLGESAQPALRQALDSRPTPEKQRRLQGLLYNIALHQWQPTPEILRQLRAVEVLEHLDTPEARKLLETLAEGSAEARQTREAKRALDRLMQRRRDRNHINSRKMVVDHVGRAALGTERRDEKGERQERKEEREGVGNRSDNSSEMPRE